MTSKIMKLPSSRNQPERQPFFGRPGSAASFFDNRVQAKLTVGAAGDHYEQEADAMADRIAHATTGAPQMQAKCEACAAEERVVQRQAGEEEGEMIQTKAIASAPLLQRQAPDEEEGLLQAKRSADASPEVSDAAQGAIRSLPGRGEPLPDSVRSFMEPHFGHDFSGVRVHNDAQAHQLARSINALAFTVGPDVVFGAGAYSPESESGRRLLAHELTHVVQPSGGAAPARVQRKIVVAGKPYTPTSTYLAWLKTNYSDAMVEFINGMDNGGSPPEFLFDSFEQMGKEVRVRNFAVQGIEEVHKGCCSYATSGGDGKLNPTFWDKKGPYQFVVKSPLPAGKETSDAIEAIFASGAGTELECNSTTVAIQYRAMLKATGPAAFNKKFPNGAGVIISPHHVPPAGVSVHPFWDKKLYKQVTIASASELLPGDWVYFKNIPDYGARHPGGFWTGEHALYLGGGKFRGFGTKELTEVDMNKELLKEYNSGLAAADQKALADLPGRQDYARRPVIAEITK